MELDRLIGVEELAEMIGRKPATIRSDLCRSPERLPPRVLLDGRKRQRPQWKQSTVARWLAEQREGGNAALAREIGPGPAPAAQKNARPGRPRNAVSI
jgi:predicted transcriptional regulator